VLANDEVSIELIGCPVHVPVPFFGFIDKVKPRNKKVIVTDSLVGIGSPDGTLITYRDGRQVYVTGGVLRMKDADPKIDGKLTGSIRVGKRADIVLIDDDFNVGATFLQGRQVRTDG
jgi:N-acetylglucosamine-6-phosphate deacetylase